MRREEVFLAALIFIFANCLCSPNILYHDEKLYAGSRCTLAGGGRGTCVLKSNCTRNLENQREVIICGFDKSEPIICCPHFNYTGPYPTLVQACYERIEWVKNFYRFTQSTEEAKKQGFTIFANYWSEPSSIRASHAKNIAEKCKREASLLYKTHKQQREYEFKCMPPERVSSDTNSAPDVYPAVQNDNTHMVALGWMTRAGGISWDCGGTLIHKSFVLTAAHCIGNFRRRPHIARIADVDLNYSFDDKNAVNYDIEQVFIHDNYTNEGYYNDVAILKVKKQREFRFKMRPLPACVFVGEKLPVNKLLLMGYGAPEISKENNERLYEGNLTILGTSECKKTYEASQLLPRGLVDHQLCAHDPDGLLDTCQGDSGGPLIFRTNDTYRTPYVVAVISFGVLCNEGKPGVYTRLFSFLDWIEKTITENY